MDDAIGYIRVTSKKQAKDGVSLDAQRAMLAAYAARADLTLVEVITDAGRTAKTLRRPGLQRALEQLRAGRAKVLLCAKLDRLTRRVADLETLLHRHFGADAPHRLALAAEPHDAKTATGRLTLRILAALAEYELDTVEARTQTVVDHKRDANEAVGPTPFGFDRNGDMLVPNQAEQLVLARMRGLRDAGAGDRAIARTLRKEGHKTKRGGAWDATTVRRMLAPTSPRPLRPRLKSDDED